MGKISRTFSIDDKVYEKFESICNTKKYNKSKILQGAIKSFIGENYDIDKSLYYKLRYGNNDEMVQIQKKEHEFIFLDNGNIVNIFDFEMLYESEDQGVKKVLKDLQSDKGLELDEDDIVYPDFLDNPAISVDMSEEIHNFITRFDIKSERDSAIFIKQSIEPLEPLKEMLSLDRTEILHIIKRMKDQKEEIRQFDKNNIKHIVSTLEYIFDTNVSIYLTSGYRVKIAKIYQSRIELQTLLKCLGNYELEDLDEEFASSMLKNKISLININKSNNKVDELRSKLTMITECSVEVKYDNPLYIIKLPKRYMSEEIHNFITRFDIKSEHIILKDINVA